MTQITLTNLSQAGGCGCKQHEELLSEILCTLKQEHKDPSVIVDGDSVKLYVIFSSTNEPKISEILFNGESCAVTKASASLMTERLKNRNIEETKHLLSSFYSLVTDPEFSLQTEEDNLGDLKIFNSLCYFPSRRTCALLPWKAMEKLSNQFDNK